MHMHVRASRQIECWQNGDRTEDAHILRRSYLQTSCHYCKTMLHRKSITDAQSGKLITIKCGTLIIRSNSRPTVRTGRPFICIYNINNIIISSSWTKWFNLQTCLPCLTTQRVVQFETSLWCISKACIAGTTCDRTLSRNRLITLQYCEVNNCTHVMRQFDLK